MKRIRMRSLARRPEGLRRQCRIVGALTLALAVASLCGCSLSLSSSSRPGQPLQGRVFGGQQPVSGASIDLYAAGSAGPGAGAVDLLAPNIVTTDASGSFAITGDYKCPTPTTPVYLVALGGDPGLPTGESNPALVMMAALGSCGNLTDSTNIVINEATTVAAAWALAQFMGSGAIVGSTATNTAGLENAFAIASNLADTSTGLAPGSALPEGAVTESAKLYTLADALAVCVNSDGGSACAPLFTAATTSAGIPENTLDAALNIVRNPGTNVSAVFNAVAAQGPFQPALSVQPNDWTMSITYGGCASGCGGLNLPGSMAIDSGGNVLVANYFGGVISKFSPTGVPASAAGFPGVGLNDSYGIAIDGFDNAWVTNEQGLTAAHGHNTGSISEFSSAGVELSGYGYTGGGIYYPLAAAADSNGEIWIADYGSSRSDAAGQRRLAHLRWQRLWNLRASIHLCRRCRCQPQRMVRRAGRSGARHSGGHRQQFPLLQRSRRNCDRSLRQCLGRGLQCIGRCRVVAQRRSRESHDHIGRKRRPAGHRDRWGR